MTKKSRMAFQKKLGQIWKTNINYKMLTWGGENDSSGKPCEKGQSEELWLWLRKCKYNLFGCNSLKKSVRETTVSIEKLKCWELEIFRVEITK
jgi:hypothetical protein